MTRHKSLQRCASISETSVRQKAAHQNRQNEKERPRSDERKNKKVIEEQNIANFYTCCNSLRTLTNKVCQ